MTTLIELLLSTLSIWSCVEVLHHSQLFSRIRAYLEARGGFISELVSCPYCLSHWVGMATAVISVLVFEETLTIKTAGLWFLVWIASVRVANWLNDVNYVTCRTPRGDRLPTFEMQEDGEENDENR